MSSPYSRRFVASLLGFGMVVAFVTAGEAQQPIPTPPPQTPPPAPTGYMDTPMQPNGKWHVHDDDAAAAGRRHAGPVRRAAGAR